MPFTFKFILCLPLVLSSLPTARVSSTFKKYLENLLFLLLDLFFAAFSSCWIVCCSLELFFKSFLQHEWKGTLLFQLLYGESNVPLLPPRFQTAWPENSEQAHTSHQTLGYNGTAWKQRWNWICKLQSREKERETHTQSCYQSRGMCNLITLLKFLQWVTWPQPQVVIGWLALTDR